MRDYSREFRMEVVRRILSGEKVPALSRELGIHRKLLYTWMRQVSEGGESNLRDRGRPRKIDTAVRASETLPQQISALEQAAVQHALIIDFLSYALQRTAETTQNHRDWRNSIFETIEMLTRRKGGLSAETMCKLARVARSGYYRYLRTKIQPPDC
ncbi:MAG: helix-turn-helix domain-containing protein [Bryobacteraceae bacterium]